MGAFAVAVSVVSANPLTAAPDGAVSETPPFGQVGACEGEVGDGGAVVGLGWAIKTSVASPRTPTIRFWSASAYQARNTREPSGVTASDGYAPPSVPDVAIALNDEPFAPLARCTLVSASAYQAT